MTQPAVTFQVRQLEEQLNTRLFDRAQGRISLTFAGTIAFEYADRILALSEELDSRMKELSGQLAGPLLIGASTTIADFLLPQILGRIQGTLSSGHSTTLRCQLRSGTGANRGAKS